MMIKKVLTILVLFSILPVSFVAGQTTEIIPDTGYYLIRSNIDGAEVYFDNELMGVIESNKLLIEVPITTKPLYSTFSVTASGYSTYNGTILRVPLPGETIDMRGNLKQNPITGTGTISIGCSPINTSVYLDSVFTGTIDYSGIMRINDVAPGQHVLLFEMDGYEGQEQFLYVNANMINQILVELIPIPKGNLIVTSVPSGASVMIDEVYRGITPLTLPGMNVDNYDLIVSMPGYHDWIGSVYVPYNSTGQIEAVLDPLPTPTTKPTTQPTPIPTTPSAGVLPVITLCALCLVSLIYLRRI
ncbi:MAG: PEGA domain-containing protein [Methanospirillaceae archaeon]|nr:PEGA domain-containing protein [Methanospirillaceae archaeon]